MNRTAMLREVRTGLASGMLARPDDLDRTDRRNGYPERRRSSAAVCFRGEACLCSRPPAQLSRRSDKGDTVSPFLSSQVDESGSSRPHATKHDHHNPTGDAW